MELNHLLNYKNLKIFQENNSFRFSLDTVLLSHFVTLTLRTKKILDIGTGNAPIPLILSTKTNAKITAVEIQKESVYLAKQSVHFNQLANQIDIIHADIKKWYREIESDTFDVIVCNPPYFKMSKTSYVNENRQKTIARHTVTLDIDDIFKIGKKLLKNNGRIALVHRPERLIEIITCMKKNHIEPKKICFVYPYARKNANMLLIEGSKNGRPGLEILDPIYVYKDGKYTDQIVKYFEEEPNVTKEL